MSRGGSTGTYCVKSALKLGNLACLFQEKVASGINIILQHERGLQEARLIVLSYFRRDTVLPPWSGGLHGGNSPLAVPFACQHHAHPSESYPHNNIDCECENLPAVALGGAV